MLLTLRQQIPPHLLPQASQRVELLIVKFRSPVHSWFVDFREPLGTMVRSVNLLAGTRDGPTAIDGFHSRHHPGEISGDCQITANLLLQGSQAVVCVIDRT